MSPPSVWMPVLAALAATAANIDSFAQTTMPFVSDPVRYVLQQLPRQASDYAVLDSPLYRITRDYNRDGLPDMALAFEDLCGEGTGCAFELFIRLDDGRYADVGVLPGFAETEELQTLTPGTARLIWCHTTRDGANSIEPIRISATGMRYEPTTTPTEAEFDAQCTALGRYPNGERRADYVWELCSVRDYLRERRCTWRRRG